MLHNRTIACCCQQRGDTHVQEAIDPSYGNEEVAALHKDVSRLRHRFEDLMREQERMVLEMERAVSKRDIIAMKVHMMGHPSFTFRRV